MLICLLSTVHLIVFVFFFLLCLPARRQSRTHRHGDRPHAEQRGDLYEAVRPQIFPQQGVNVA